MGIKRKIFLSLLALNGLSLQAEAQVTIRGTVTESEWNAVLYPATIVDSASGHVVYSDALGHYSIRAHAGDILVYRYLGFHAATYRVPGGRPQRTHNVVLVYKRVQLNTIEVRALTPYQKDSLERIRTFGHYLHLPIAHFFWRQCRRSGCGFSSDLSLFKRQRAEKAVP